MELEAYLKRYQWSIFLVLLGFGLLLAWSNRFVQDDAFISFNYAKALVEGKGLTWYGTVVEGYTNFLWVIWIAFGFFCQFDPISWSYLGGLCAFIGTCYGIWYLSSHFFSRFSPGVIALLLWTSNYTVSCYATGGLETMWQTCFLCLSLVLFYQLQKGNLSLCLFCTLFTVRTSGFNPYG